MLPLGVQACSGHNHLVNTSVFSLSIFVTFVMYHHHRHLTLSYMWNRQIKTQISVSDIFDLLGCRLLFSYGRFEVTCRYRLQRPSTQRNVVNYNLSFVTSQKIDDIIYTAAESWNRAFLSAIFQTFISRHTCILYRPNSKSPTYVSRFQLLLSLFSCHIWRWYS